MRQRWWRRGSAGWGLDAGAACLVLWTACASPPPSATAASAPPGQRVHGKHGAAPHEAPEPPKRVEADSQIGKSYDAYLAKYKNLTYPKLAAELKLDTPADAPLSFEPAKVQYFDQIARELQLTPKEAAIFAKQGIVSVDHDQRYSMGSAYFAIYARDLPVLVTSDSILHALHRSYDEILKQLEVGLFTHTIRETLRAAHEQLATRAPALKSKALQDSARDLDVYLTVARNLLEGAGAPGASAADLNTAPKLGQDDQARTLLGLIASLKLQRPLESPPTPLNGGARYVDYSQFKPRGHYTESEELKRYFRTLMWLGRADLGFFLDPPDPASGLEVNVERERRDGVLLSMLIRDAKQLKRLGTMSNIIDFMVGRSDNVTIGQMTEALAKDAKAEKELDDPAALARLRSALAAMAGEKQQIRSQIVTAPRGKPDEVVVPQLFQLFGQRFTLDSFVLSRVVYDSIRFETEKPERLVPSGLDVMGALGNDEAVRLLRPELEKYMYSANLLAARRAVETQEPSEWNKNLYTLWLDTLRTLDDTPEGSHVPEVMQRTPWRRKQLQTQLASWAELRHDTILYAKQSYTADAVCGYPDGYVEPYPEFYARLGLFARRGAELLAAADLSDAPDARLQGQRDRQVAFLKTFAGIMQSLEQLAKKELAAQPFSDEERRFLEKTIDIRGGGSGPPRYDGWYPQLTYRVSRDDNPSTWKPTVADVHTSGGSDKEPPKVLEAGVGDVEFLVVAIDNEKDRAAYVGPVYSYYEFTVPPDQRLTDEEWQARITGNKLPPRPSWTDVFRAPAQLRKLEMRTRPPEPRLVELNEKYQKLSELLSLAEHDPVERRRFVVLLATTGAEIRAFTLEPAQASSKPSKVPSLEKIEAMRVALANKPFNRTGAEKALFLASNAAEARCSGQGSSGPATVAITFEPSGTVSAIEIADPAIANSPAGACIVRRFAEVRVRPFRGQPVTMSRKPVLKAQAKP